MSEVFSGAGGWWLGSALGGGAVLLICGLLMRRTTAPAARQRLGEWGIVAAVLVAVLRMAPSWISVPDPWPTAESKCEECPIAIAVTPMSDNPQVAWTYRPTDVVTDAPTLMANLPQAVPVENPVVECRTASNWTIGVLDGLLVGYGALAAFFLCRWLLGLWGLARILRRARPAPANIQNIFDQMVAETGQRQIRLCVSDRIPVPMCCGLRRPTVVMPAPLIAQADVKILRWVFAHELTHLARRDTWSTWFMGLAQSLYFYLPLFWWVRRQVRLCQEYIADAAAAKQGPWADDYAQFLVSLAQCPAAPMGATGVLGNTSDLYRRVTMLLKPSAAPAGPRSRRQLFSGVSCLIASAIILAGLGVRAETPDDKKEKKEVKGVIVEGKPGELKREVIVIVNDDDDKKDGEKKKEGEKKDVIIKRVKPAEGMQGVIAAVKMDKAELEKKIRKALEKTDLGEDEVKKILKEVMSAMEQANKQIHAELMPKIAEFHPEMKAFPGGKFEVFQPGQSMTWVAHGGGGRLGVLIEKPSQTLVDQLDLSKDQGIVVQQVMKGSTAEKAGFKTNDIILKFAEKSVSSDVGQFVKMIDGMSADKEFTAVVLRKGKKEVLEGIKLGDKKKEGAFLGDKVLIEGGDAEVAKKYRAIAELHAKDADKHAAEVKKLMAELHARDGDKKSEQKQRSVSVTVKDGEYQAKETDGELTITVAGTMEGGKVEVNSVTINDGGEKTSYKSLDKVPSKYRARIEKLIAGSGDSPVRVRVRTDKSDD